MVFVFSALFWIGLVEEGNEKEDWEIQRDHHKSLGDAAFRSQGYKTAIDEYTKAITVDPEFVVLYSNRSAAYLKNGEKSKALRDAEKCVSLDPKFVKGYSRLATALFSLTRYVQAQETYRIILKSDPNNAVAKKGVEDCQKFIDHIKAMEEKAKRDGYQQNQYEIDDDDKDKDKKEQEKSEEGGKAKAGDDEDDMLNDFFDDVEEVVAQLFCARVDQHRVAGAQGLLGVVHAGGHLAYLAHQLPRPGNAEGGVEGQARQHVVQAPGAVPGAVDGRGVRRRGF